MENLWNSYPYALRWSAGSPSRGSPFAWWAIRNPPGWSRREPGRISRTAWPAGASRRAVELEKEGLCGYIFKSKSPSSGMERVKIYDANGVPSNRGVGMFAMAFMKHFPLLPVEEDARLHDPGLRENFIERIFLFRRWREMLARGKKIGHLVEFHTQHKLLLLEPL